MKIELLFIWINQDDHECFHPMAFNFSLEYDKRVLAKLTHDIIKDCSEG